MLCKLVNTSRGHRVVHGIKGRTISIAPNKSVEAELRDKDAIALRRYQNSGALLHVEALTDEGKAMLEDAGIVNKPQPGFKPRIKQRVKPVQIRDELLKPPQVDPVDEPFTEEAQPEQELKSRRGGRRAVHSADG